MRKSFFPQGQRRVPRLVRGSAPKRAKPRLARPRLATLRKPYPNQHEQMFAELARELGWQVTKKGWPDFFCFNSDSEDAIFVEVKPPGQKLRGSQWLIMRTLTRMGAKCFVSDGVTLTPFDADASIYRLVQPNHDVYAGEWII